NGPAKAGRATCWAARPEAATMLGPMTAPTVVETSTALTARPRRAGAAGAGPAERGCRVGAGAGPETPTDKGRKNELPPAAAGARTRQARPLGPRAYPPARPARRPSRWERRPMAKAAMAEPPV